jgi:ribulose kinase
MVKSGHKIELMYMCGGLRKNQLYVKTHVDVTGKNNLYLKADYSGCL